MFYLKFLIIIGLFLYMYILVGYKKIIEGVLCIFFKIGWDNFWKNWNINMMYYIVIRIILC